MPMQKVLKATAIPFPPNSETDPGGAPLNKLSPGLPLHLITTPY
jgi:hypothetical protein